MSEFRAPIAAAPLAHYTRIAVCPNGCPVLVLSDEDGTPLAAAHIPADRLEALITDLRRARAEGEALLRPVA